MIRALGEMICYKGLVVLLRVSVNITTHKDSIWLGHVKIQCLLVFVLKLCVGCALLPTIEMYTLCVLVTTAIVTQKCVGQTR